MMRHFTSRHVAFAAAGGLVAAVLFSGVAQAITDTVFKYSTPRTSYYSIAPMALNPMGDDFAKDYSREYFGGLRNIGTAMICFATGINLPHGATMTKVTAFYKNAVGDDPSFTLATQKLATGNATFVLGTGVDDSGAAAAVDLPITPILIDNLRNAYEFATCINPGDAFLAARVTYTAVNAGD